MDLSFREFIPDLTSTLTPPRFPPFGFESDARRFTTTDGLHFSRSIIEAQANLLLNFRCNDVLSKKCPVDKTCRRSCPHLSLLHLLVITAVCLAAPAFWYYSYHTSLSFSLHNNRHIHFILVGQINPATWISDEHLPVFIVGGRWRSYTLSTGQVSGSRNKINSFFGSSVLGTVKRADNDLGFLNQEQTDEWKGWMQSGSLDKSLRVILELMSFD